MKGITPIIAIMLLLMITISMIGFAYMWFTRISESAMNKVENITEQNRENIGKTIMIDSVTGGASSLLFIRNTGTYTIQPSEISVYVGGALASCTLPSSIAPGEIKSCSISGNCAGLAVKVSAPGNFDEITCR